MTLCNITSVTGKMAVLCVLNRGYHKLTHVDSAKCLFYVFRAKATRARLLETPRIHHKFDFELILLAAHLGTIYVFQYFHNTQLYNSTEDCNPQLQEVLQWVNEISAHLLLACTAVNQLSAIVPKYLKCINLKGRKVGWYPRFRYVDTWS